MATDTLTKEEVLDFFRANKELIKKKFCIENIILFGSFARGEATPDSDVDILIESKKRSFDQRYDLRRFLENKLKKDVDVVYLSSVHPFIMRFIREELVYA